MKAFLINFWVFTLINIWGFTQLIYFTKCTLTIIKSIANISCIGSYVLPRTRVKMKFIDIKISVAIYNSFMNIVYIAISVFKLTCLFNTQTNLVMFAVTWVTFRFAGVSVCNICPYQIIFKDLSFTSTNHGRLLPKKQFCVPRST